MNRILEAALEFSQFGCPKCQAAKGDPCRTPNWKTTRPHKERRALKAPASIGEASLGVVDFGSTPKHSNTGETS
jgi:hypothetical protein